MSSRTLAKTKNQNSTTFSPVFGKKLYGQSFATETANEARDVSNPGFGHNFDDVQVESPSFKQSSPLFLSGLGRGAYHTCPPRVQAKLKIGQPGDKYEQEADRVADQVMRMPEPQVQRKGYSFPDCKEEDEDKILQAKSVGGVRNARALVDHPAIQNVLPSPGQPLDAATRSFMEQRFGQDFSRIRVHTDGKAAESARAVNAQAYTVGRDVVFGKGEYAPGGKGRKLIAHELEHVVQQTEMPSFLQTKKKSQSTFVEGGGATPGKGDGIDVVFIIQSPEDAFTKDVKKYIQSTLTGQEYYMVNDLRELFFRLNIIATGGKSQYVPSIIDEMTLTPEEIRSRDIEIPPRKVRRIRLVAHGQSGIGGVKMGAYGEDKKFVSPDKILEFAKQPRIQKIVKNAMTPDAVVEFWGCNIGTVPKAGEAWSNLFQSKFKATGDTFKTGFDQFYRRPDPGEQGKIVDGLKDEVVQVVNSSEVYSRNTNLIKSFESWLLRRYDELVTNGDILPVPVKGRKNRLLLMKDIFNKSNGDIKYIQIERKSDSKLIRPGNKKRWKKLWKEFSPVRIGNSP